MKLITRGKLDRGHCPRIDGRKVTVTIHNLDRFMSDLRTTVAQGRKRIGFLIGAGAAAGLPDPTGTGPLIPAIDLMTSQVVAALRPDFETVFTAIEARGSANIEAVLTRVRSLGGIIGCTGGLDQGGLLSRQEEHPPAAAADTSCRQRTPQLTAHEALALTKMNWNNDALYDPVSVSIRYSQKLARTIANVADLPRSVYRYRLFM